MPYGVIEDFSEVVQWKIPNFLDQIRKGAIESPKFSSVGCTWFMTLRWGSRNLSDGCFFPVISQFAGPYKKVTYIFGLKSKDATIKESLSYINTVVGPGRWFLKDLQARESELIPSGTLTLTCRIEREVPAAEQFARNPQEVNFPTTTFVELEDLSSDLQDLLNSEKTCDFTVNVQGKEFRVHRSLLGTRSSVFRAMLEHDTAEAKRGVLDIPDCHPESFREFINFLYTGKIEEVTFETAYHLYSTAEKYDVQRLKSRCVSYLKQNLSADNVCKVVVLADQFCDEQLQSSAQDFFNKNCMQIFLTSEWEVMMRNHSRIFDKVLKEMASARLKNSLELDFQISSSFLPG